MKSASSAQPTVGTKHNIPYALIVEIALVALLLIAAIVIKSQYVGVALERDEGSYTYYGQLILEGKSPYKDFSETKLPGLYYFYALMVWVCGFSYTSIQTGFIVVYCVSILSLYTLCRRLLNPLAAIVGALVFAVLSLNPFASGFTYQSEHVVAMFFTLGFMVYSFRSESNARWIAAASGLLLGFAVTIKTNAIFLYPIPLVTLAVLSWDKSKWKSHAIEAVVYSFAYGAAIIFSIAPVLLQNNQTAMYGSVVQSASNYVSQVPFSIGITYLTNNWLRISQNYMFFFYLAGSSIIMALLSRSFKHALLFAFVGCAAFLTVVPGFWFYGHYWLQLFPAVGFLCAAAVWKTTSLQLFGKYSSAILSAIVVLVVTVGLSQHYKSSRFVYKKPSKEAIVDQVYGGNPFNEALEIGKYINTIKKPGGGMIASIGSEPQMFLYTNTRSISTKFLWVNALFSGGGVDSLAQVSYIADFERHKPEFAIFYKHPISIMARPGFSMHFFNWMNPYLQKYYKLVGVVDMFGLPRGSVYTFGAERAQAYKPSGAYQIFVFQRL